MITVLTGIGIGIGVDLAFVGLMLAPVFLLGRHARELRADIDELTKGQP